MLRGRRLLWPCAGLLSGCFLFAVGATGCDSKEKEELKKQFDDASNKLLDCRKETSQLKAEVSGLKRQLAQAAKNPGKLVLTDPEVIELVASMKGTAEDTGEGPDPKAASKIVMQGAQALQQCYERALKKNQQLQYQAGLKLLLGLTIKGSGAVEDVSVTPSVDKDLTQCIKTSAMRWKFPTFTAKSVDIEQSIVLTPKT